MSYIPESYRDLFRDLQFVDEGDVVADPTKFGAGFPSNPVFKFLGKNQRFRVSYNPDGFPVQTLSDENRTEIVLVKKSAQIVVDFDLTDYAYNGDLSWLLELHKNDFKSRAAFYSRKPAATEYFKKFYGIVPTKTTLTRPDAGDAPVHITVEMLATLPIDEDTTGPVLGTGSYAQPITVPPLKTADAGNNYFTYNSQNFKTRGAQIVVSPLYQTLDPDESLTIQHMRPVARQISGTVKVFKKQGADTFHADIQSKTLRPMSWVLKPSPSGTRIDLTNVLISDNDTDNYSDVKSDSNIKEYSFSAGGLALANLA
jgi:hypothetical protein